MPLCPSGQQTIIEWQFEGEEKQQILGATDYSVQSLKGQCPIRYKFEVLYARQETFGTDYNWTQRGRGGITTGNGPISNIYIKNLTTGQIYKDIVNNPGLVNNTTSIGYSTEFINTGVVNPNGTWAVFWTEGNGVEKNLSLANYSGYRAYGFTTLYSNQPDNCATLFQVTKNGQVVYSKINSQQPTVTHRCGEECPPGTCECTNGSTVCCYDPNTGIAVKSFTR
jgi:hypothetical protein